MGLLWFESFGASVVAGGLSVCLSFGLFALLFVCLSVGLLVCLFICPLVCQSVGLCVCLSGFLQFVCDFVCWCLCLCLCWCLPFCEYLCLCQCLCLCRCQVLELGCAIGLRVLLQQHCSISTTATLQQQQQHCGSNAGTTLQQQQQEQWTNRGNMYKLLGNPCHQFPEFGNPYGLGALGSQDPWYTQFPCVFNDKQTYSILPKGSQGLPPKCSLMGACW